MIARSTFSISPVPEAPRIRISSFVWLGIVIVPLLIFTSIRYPGMVEERSTGVRYAITFGFLLLLSLVTLKNLSAGVFFFLGIIPLFAVLSQKGLVNTNIVSYLTFVVVLIVWGRHKESVVRKPAGQFAFIFFIMFNVISLISTVLQDGANSAYFPRGSTYLLSAGAMFAALYILIPVLSRQEIKYSLSAFIFGIVLVAIWFLIEYVVRSEFDVTGQISRLGMESGINPNSFASYCMMGIIYVASINREKIKWGMRFLIMAALGITLFLTGTRTSISGTVAGLLIAFALGQRISKMRIIIQVALGIVVVLVSISATGLVQKTFFDLLLSRYTNLFTINLSDATQMAEISANRTVIWQIGWQTFLSEPILGIGLGRFGNVTQASGLLGTKETSAHSLYMNILVEQGLIGMILFIIWLFALFGDAIKRSRWAACVLGWLVAYLLLGFSGGYAISFVFGFLLGGIGVVFEDAKAVPSPTSVYKTAF